MTEPEIRADERRKIAAFVREFSWALPLYKDRRINEAQDDAACAVCVQVAEAILKGEPS